jgi:hypothetical protein
VIESEFQEVPSPPAPDFPWPPREGESVLNALATTWKESVFQPTTFFRRMPREFDFGWVLGYYLIMGVVSAGISLFWSMVLGPSLMEWWMPGQLRQSGTGPVIDFLLSPLMLLLALFVGAGIFHLFLLIFRGAKHGFGTTLRVLCFSSGPFLFEIVPILGSPVAGIWSLVLTVIGLREAHETSTGKVVAAVLLPMFFLLMLMGLLMVAAALIGLGRAVG